MDNKFSKYSTRASASSIVLWFLSGLMPEIAYLGAFAGFAGVVLGIKALFDYQNNKEAGGLALAVIAIIVGLLFAYMSIKPQYGIVYVVRRFT